MPGAVTKNWRISGSTAAALGPGTSWSTGTSRQPRQSSPSSRATGSMSAPRSCAGDALDERAQLRRASVVREERDTHRIFTMRRQLEARLRPEEVVGDLEQDARAVARVDLRAARAAVLEVVEHPQRLLQRGVRALVREIGDRSDATGVVFKPWVVEARGPRS